MTNLLDRLPPQNLVAEKALLGSILLQPDGMKAVTEITKLQATHFYAEAHQKLFGCLLVRWQDHEPIDSVAVLEDLKQTGHLEAVGGAAYLAEVLQSVATADHVRHYAAIVKDKAERRRLIALALDVLRGAYDDSDPAVVWRKLAQHILAMTDCFPESPRNEGRPTTPARTEPAKDRRWGG